MVAYSADDTALLADNKTNMRWIIQKVDDDGKTADLKLNSKKGSHAHYMDAHYRDRKSKSSTDKKKFNRAEKCDKTSNT